MTALLFGVLGFGVGVLVGIVLDDVWEMMFPGRKFLAMLFNSPKPRFYYTIALVITLTLNVIIGGLLWLTRKSANDYYTCMADWQQESAAAQQVRIGITERVQDALDAIIRSVASGNQDEFHKAVARYVALRDEQERQRKQTPLPELPKAACGEPKEIRR